MRIDNLSTYTTDRPSIVRRRANAYFEIEVKIGGTKPMRELIQATCKAEALEKARAKYKYVRAVVSLVPSKDEKLQVKTKVRRRRRKKDPEQPNNIVTYGDDDPGSQGDDANSISTPKDQAQA